MSDVVTAIEESFKELVKDRPLRSVTVKDICAGAHVSRNTFYANFIDRRAVLAKIFRADAIEPVQRVIALLPPEDAIKIAPVIIARFYQGVYDNGDMYANIVPQTSSSDNTFALTVARAVYKLTVQTVESIGFNGTEPELRKAAFYHSSAQALSLQDWIAKRYETPIEVLANLQTEMILPFWAARTGMELPSFDGGIFPWDKHD